MIPTNDYEVVTRERSPVKSTTQQQPNWKTNMDSSTPNKQAETSAKTSPSSSGKDPLEVSDVTNAILEFLPQACYLYVAPLNTVFEQAWADSERKKGTAPVSVGMTEAQLLECHETGLSMVPYAEICTQMAKLGRLDLLVRERQLRGGQRVPLSVMSASALVGNLEITNFVYEDFINWAHGLFTSVLQDALRDAFSKGVESGEMEVVRWFISKGCKAGGMEYNTASMNGHTQVLEYLMGVSGELDDDTMSECMDNAIEGGHIDTVKYLQTVGADLDGGIPTISAVMSGDLEMLKYVVSQGALCWEDTVGTVGFVGKLEFLEYLKNTPGAFRDGLDVNNGYDILYNAVGSCHYEVLKWCYDNGYAMYAELCEIAARDGNLDMVKWLREHGSPFGETGAIAKKGGYIKLYAWARMNGCDA